MKVNELMSLEFVSLPSNASLFQVVNEMTTNNKSCIIICEEKVPVGIVTERDIVSIYKQQMDFGEVKDIPVNTIMTQNPICSFENSDLYEALLLARSHRVRHIPVVNENEHLVGLLTQTDTLEAYLTAWEKTTELKAANEHLRLLSLEDSLLEIGNRRSLNMDMSHIETVSARVNTHYAIAMIDVDNFKNYNDHYGHQEGDKTLVSIVDSIKKNKRDEDRVYRYGGEEVLLLMPNTKLDEAKSALERIRKSIEQLEIEHVKSEIGLVTVSVGLASSEKHNWKETVKLADQALYKAKKNGKNQTCIVEEAEDKYTN